MGGKGKWLNLGACDDIRKYFDNVDLSFPAAMYEKFAEDRDTVMTVADLNDRWPWADGTVDYILALDIIEHLQDKIHTMNEAWRVMKNGGIFHIEVPTTDGLGAFQDPTHVSFWNRNSFFYFTDGDPHRVRFGEAYGITAKFKLLKYKHQRLDDNVIKLTISLECVK